MSRRCFQSTILRAESCVFVFLEAKQGRRAVGLSAVDIPNSFHHATFALGSAVHPLP